MHTWICIHRHNLKERIHPHESRPSEQPRQNIIPNNVNILIGFPKQQRMHHALIHLNRLILTPSLTIQLPTHIRIRNNICTPMQHNKRNTHITHPPIQQIRNPQKLHNSPQPWLPSIPQRIHFRNNLLMVNFHRLVQKIRRGNNGQSRKKPRQKSQDLRDRPFRSNIVRDFTHRGNQNGAVEPFRVEEVDHEAYGTSHGFAVEETREVRVLLFDGIEEWEAILCGEVYVGDECFEAVGLAVTLEIERETGEGVLGEEDRSGLEGPGDVVAVAVDHEDEGAWWSLGIGEPWAREESEAARGCEVGLCGCDSLLLVVLLFWCESPVVGIRVKELLMLLFLLHWLCFAPHQTSPLSDFLLGVFSTGLHWAGSITNGSILAFSTHIFSTHSQSNYCSFLLEL